MPAGAGRARRGPAAGRLVPRQDRGRGHRLSRHREGLQAPGCRPAMAAAPPDAAAIRAARSQYPLSSALYRLPGGAAELPGRARSELRRPCRRRRAVVHRLSRRGAMGRGRDGEGMVRAGEVAAVLPRAPRRPRSAATRRRPTTPISTSDDRSAKLGSPTAPRARASTSSASTAPDAIPEAAARLAEFLAAGHHGTMAWLATTAGAPRRAPRALWPEARAVVMLGLNYGPDGDPLASLALKDRGTISVYARNRDYHDLIKGKLKRLAGRFAARTGSAVKVFVDTAPLMEKPLAAAAGLGWQGKHTNLVSREFGSWLFLGAILTEAALPPDAAEADHCGTLPRLPRRLPDQRLSRALPARCAPLHLLPHHRAQGPDPARVPQGDRQPHLRLRRLPGRLPVEQVRAGDARGEARRPRRSRRAAARRARRPRRCRLPRAVSPARRSSASAATASSATC